MFLIRNQEMEEMEERNNSSSSENENEEMEEKEITTEIKIIPRRSVRKRKPPSHITQRIHFESNKNNSSLKPTRIIAPKESAKRNRKKSPKDNNNNNNNKNNKNHRKKSPKDP
eukprot:121602_1